LIEDLFEIDTKGEAEVDVGVLEEDLINGNEDVLARTRARSASQNAANCELIPETWTFPGFAGNDLGRLSGKIRRFSETLWRRNDPAWLPETI